MNKAGKYSGVGNLETMTEAVHYNQFLQKLITDNLSKSGRVLDFGAGIGTFDDELRRQGYELECLEIDEALVDGLKERGYTVWSDTQQIKDETINSIFSLNVLEHIEDDGAVLQELLRVLAPNGKLLIYVPAFMLLFGSMDRKVKHFRRYRKSPLVAKLKAAGYAVPSARYVDAVGFMAALAFRFVGNPKGDLNPGMVRFFDHWVFPLNKLLDPIFGNILGKNVFVIAQKPAK
jgi:SAM-dependent methyltransferase